jgi:hypothetical protein
MAAPSRGNQRIGLVCTPHACVGHACTLPAVLPVAVVVAVELLVLRTGLFHRPAY